VFFFFQAEDGIRDLTVTGVQTCALPISREGWDARTHRARVERPDVADGWWYGRREPDRTSIRSRNRQSYAGGARDRGREGASVMLVRLSTTRYMCLVQQSVASS